MVRRWRMREKEGGGGKRQRRRRRRVGRASGQRARGKERGKFD